MPTSAPMRAASITAFQQSLHSQSPAEQEQVEASCSTRRLVDHTSDAFRTTNRNSRRLPCRSGPLVPRRHLATLRIQGPDTLVPRRPLANPCRALLPRCVDIGSSRSPCSEPGIRTQRESPTTACGHRFFTVTLFRTRYPHTVREDHLSSYHGVWQLLSYHGAWTSVRHGHLVQNPISAHSERGSFSFDGSWEAPALPPGRSYNR